MLSYSIHEKKRALRIAVGIFILMMILLHENSVSAIPYEEWNNTFSNFGATSVQQTSDGGYILVGDYTLLKTDAKGNQLWRKTFREKNPGEFNSVQQTSDGGYILAGEKSCGTDENPGPSDAWLLKTDMKGDQQWSKTLTFGGEVSSPFYHNSSCYRRAFEYQDLCGCAGSLTPHSIQRTSDGGYILAGDIWGITGGNTAWLAKTDKNAHLLWERTFGRKNDGAYSVQQTSDGGYVFAGFTSTYGSFYDSDDVWLVKTDANGTEMWNKTFGGKAGGIAYSVNQTSDGGNILAGYSSGDFWLVKTDSGGNMQWSKAIGGKLDEWAFSVEQTLDGGYIISGNVKWISTGSSKSDVPRSSAWLVKTDANGNEVWNNTFGGINNYVGSSVHQTADEGYIVAGSRGKDAWLIKISREISTSKPTPTITITPRTTQIIIPTPTLKSQIEQVVKQSKDRLTKTEEKQNSDDSRISWLESKINSLLGWIKSFLE